MLKRRFILLPSVAATKARTFPAKSHFGWVEASVRLCQKQTLRQVSPMSALPRLATGKADVTPFECQTNWVAHAHSNSVSHLRQWPRMPNRPYAVRKTAPEIGQDSGSRL